MTTITLAHWRLAGALAWPSPTATDAGAIDYAGAFGAALSYEIGVLILAVLLMLLLPAATASPAPTTATENRSGLP